MSASAAAPPVGTVVGGKYRLTGEIGHGGMAVVFSAENVDIGKRVAVKVLAKDLADSRTVTERFLREARAAAKVRSPYICEVYDVGTDEGRPFIVMELLMGESLYDRLSRVRRMNVEDALRMARQVCRGLAKAHADHIVHRDLKPENIFLTTGEDGQEIAKLLDFGLAKFYEPHLEQSTARLTKDGALFGTPAYMSPEQAQAKRNVDQRSDLWALGCIVYEMFTGRTVWNVDQGVGMILAQVASGPLPNPFEFRSDLPPAFGDWFRKALTRDVDARFQDADEFSAGLHEAFGIVPESGLHGASSARTASGQAASRQGSSGQASPGQAASGLGPPSPAPLSPASPGVAPVADSFVSGPPTDPAPPVRRWKGIGLLGIGFVFVVAVTTWFVLPGMLTSSAGLSDPVETTADASLIAEAQAHLFTDGAKDALEKFQAAFDEQKSKTARSLLSHVSAAEQAAGACRLTAIGHPRPFSSSGESSKPSVLETSRGLLVTWASAEAAGRTSAYTVLLDSALRRISEPVDVTPESTFTREPELFQAGDRVGLIYWDFAGSAPGVYVQALDEQGQVSGQRQLLSGTQEKSHPYYPSIAKHPDGGFIGVWVETSRDRVHDLFARRLNPDFSPASKPVALTGYATSKRGKTQAARPSLDVRGGLLHVAYTLRRPTRQHLLLMRVAPKALEVDKGAVPAAVNEAPTATDEEQDRFLGQVVELGQADAKHDWATLRCTTKECYVTWDETLSAARIARVDETGSVAWQRTLTAAAVPQGKVSARPGIGLSSGSGSDALTAWYQDDRVFAAPLKESDTLEPGVLGRVSGVLQQPQPLVLPARSTGEWYVAWRGYEAGTPEPFVARVKCK